MIERMCMLRPPSLVMSLHDSEKMRKNEWVKGRCKLPRNYCWLQSIHGRGRFGWSAFLLLQCWKKKTLNGGGKYFGGCTILLLSMLLSFTGLICQHWYQNLTNLQFRLKLVHSLTKPLLGSRLGPGHLLVRRVWLGSTSFTTLKCEGDVLFVLTKKLVLGERSSKRRRLWPGAPIVKSICVLGNALSCTIPGCTIETTSIISKTGMIQLVQLIEFPLSRFTIVSLLPMTFNKQPLHFHNYQ